MRKVFVSQNQIIVGPGDHNLGEEKMSFLHYLPREHAKQCVDTTGNEKGAKCVVYI